MALLLYLTDGFKAGSVEVTRELGGFDEGTLADEFLERFPLDKEVMFPFDLSCPRRSGRVCRLFIGLMVMQALETPYGRR